MKDVVKTILTDPFAGCAGVFRFDPATGQRTHVAMVAADLTPQHSTAVSETDAGTQTQPEPGEPAK